MPGMARRPSCSTWRSRPRQRGARVTGAAPTAAASRCAAAATCINYDGSQDEGDKANDQVLRAVLRAVCRAMHRLARSHETRLIAINEGRLVDFLARTSRAFPGADGAGAAGSGDGRADRRVSRSVNLNLRSVVADADGWLDPGTPARAHDRSALLGGMRELRSQGLVLRAPQRADASRMKRPARRRSSD